MVGQGHVLEAVVWRRCGVGQPIAGAVALGGAQGAWPFAEGLRVHRVSVGPILFGPGQWSQDQEPWTEVPAGGVRGR